MPDRLAPPTRYEMMVAAERVLARQVGHYLRTGQQEVLREMLATAEELRLEIEDYETQMLGLWRLTRSEAQASQDREKGAPDAT